MIGPARRRAATAPAQLAAAAAALIAAHYVVERHQIGAVLVDADGRHHHGLHVEATIGRASLCAEPVALANAVLAGAPPAVLIAAVRHPKPTETGGPRLVPPCGLCREILLDHAPDIHVVLAGSDGPTAVPLADLLPHKYVGTKWARNHTPTTLHQEGTTMDSGIPEPDFRTAEVDDVADRVIPDEHFTLSTEDARDTYLADRRVLDAKQLAHNRYRTNPRALVDHLREHLDLTGTEELLDLGCGNGFVLEHLRPHLADGRIVGLDIAPGILAAAAARLRGVATDCTWVQGSADDLSRFDTDSFDRVMANYMMHYVPDIARALAETRRVLRPDGRFLLTTDNVRSLVEMYDVHFTALRAMGAPEGLFEASPKGRVSLDNGGVVLAEHFDTVELHTWQDQLRFAEAEPFLDFYAGHNYMCAASLNDPDLDEAFFTELRNRVRALVQAAITERGHFAVTKFTGAFVCS
ncbi:methyltransferase domain-containing protein (plasmid) [Embleya sp. NBC_00888]|uniref:methyltransferase domain-containing protein n=1 Tax=Embleya sp. NBC_00888 TaxID=2975960 RepID=UPI002F912942|nr:methyltransferase domain-containing protein [Embleya sp. NBC_00888]